VTPDPRTVGQPVISGIVLVLGRGLAEMAGPAGSVAVARGVGAGCADGEGISDTLIIGAAVASGDGALDPAVPQAATSTTARIDSPRRIARTSRSGHPR
jgi:hypothetical protein